MSLSVRPFHLLLFVGIMVVWGLNLVIGKIGIEQIPPILLMALRFGLAALLIAPFVPRPHGHWREVILISTSLGLIHFALMFTGLKNLDAAVAAVVIQLQVPFAALLAAFVFGDKLGWRRALGLVIAFAGVALIAGEPRFHGEYGPLFLVLLATLMWSVANIQIKKLEGVDGMTLNAWVAILATPQLLIASFLLEDGQWAAVTNADWRAWGSVVYQAVMVYWIGYGTWLWLLRQYEVNQAMPFTLLVPLVGVAAGVIFLDEAFTLALAAGGLLTIIGVAIILIRRPKTAAPEAERF
ncbi:MAG: EamA family transporter [Kiloniellales bacterium]|nr:EamA family transporter [Kiloniellales bacterium]